MRSSFVHLSVRVLVVTHGHASISDKCIIPKSNGKKQMYTSNMLRGLLYDLETHYKYCKDLYGDNYQKGIIPIQTQ